MSGERHVRVCRKHQHPLQLDEHSDNLVCPANGGHKCNTDFVVLDRSKGRIVGGVPIDEITKAEEQENRMDMRTTREDTKPGTKKVARFQGNGDTLWLRILRRKPGGTAAQAMEADPYSVVWATTRDRRSLRGTIGLFPTLAAAEKAFNDQVASLPAGWSRAASVLGKVRILPVPVPGAMAKFVSSPRSTKARR